jgi:hypothetical protein
MITEVYSDVFKVTRITHFANFTPQQRELYAGHLNFHVEGKTHKIMRFISTKVHGVIDYLMGVLLIAAPWLLDFARGGAETWVPVVLGAGVIIYSLLTDYELGLSRSISMRTHLSLDFWSGVFLAASPWIFGFNEVVYLPHLIFGLLEIGASLTTERTTSIATNRATDHHHRHAH